MNTAGQSAVRHTGLSRPMIAQDAPRDDKAQVQLENRLPYQLGRQWFDSRDESWRSSMYTRPIFEPPALLFGVTRKPREPYQGGRECNPSSTIWRNDGTPKIPPEQVLHHDFAPVSVFGI